MSLDRELTKSAIDRSERIFLLFSKAKQISFTAETSKAFTFTSLLCEIEFLSSLFFFCFPSSPAQKHAMIANSRERRSKRSCAAPWMKILSHCFMHNSRFISMFIVFRKRTAVDSTITPSRSDRCEAKKRT